MRLYKDTLPRPDHLTRFHLEQLARDERAIFFAEAISTAVVGMARGVGAAVRWVRGDTRRRPAARLSRAGSAML